MKTPATFLSLLPFLAGLTVANAATLIISDNYNVTGSGSGFALNSGVNSAINPPTTRLTGAAAPGLRYFATDTTKAASSYTITANKLQVAAAASSGRFTFSADGASAYDFGGQLGTAAATAANPAVYEIKVTMANSAAGTQRASFGWSTAENNANFWDFAIQLYRTNSADTFYQIGKRIDRVSYTTSTDSSGATGDLNSSIAVTGAGTFGTQLTLTIRVTDAGAESTTFNSRVQVSLDGGSTWFYDTQTDPDLTATGFRFDSVNRYLEFDIAASGAPTYDDLSINWISGPTLTSRVWSGAGSDNNWSSAANWAGVAPASGDTLIFNGTTRQTNTNDLAGLNVATLTFNNAGFSLYGNVFTNIGTISNAAGLNIIGADFAWGSTSTKLWSLGAGSELRLNDTVTCDANGDQTIVGGGTLRITGQMNIGQFSTANPAWIVNEGANIVDGGTFTSRGGYRIGSLASGPGAQTTITNGGSMSLTLPGANLRVGDSANPITARLSIKGGTLTMAGGSLAIPYAAGATGEVWATDSRISGPIVNFNQNGAGYGYFGLTNSMLETLQIKKTTGSSLSRMYFDNAILRSAPGASNAAFVSGLNIAEIETGGLTIDATSDVSIDQILRGAGGLVKSNSAAAVLTAVNTYTGTSYVQAGRLAFATVTNASSVQVADGAEFGVLVKSPGTSASIPSLSFLGASFGTLSFDLSTYSSPSAPVLKVGSLSVAGPVVINIANGVQLNTGTFTLVSYSGGIGGGYQFSLGSLPPGVTANLVNNTASNSIDLNITSVPGYRWTGAVNGDWDTGTQNWFDKQNNVPSTYADGFPTEFIDGAATGNINIPGFPSPSIIAVSNSALPYVWTGGALTVPIIRKNGPGSVTRVEIGPDLITTIELNDGSFIVNNAFDTTLATTLTDTAPVNGKFIKTGASKLTLTSTNSSYDGTVIIAEGTLKITADRALGATTGGTIISNGATLDLNDFTPGAEPVTVSGAGVGGIGAIIDTTTSTGVDTSFRDVTLAGDTTFGCPNNGRWDIRARSSTGAGPGLKGNGYNLTKVGSGYVSIACQRNIGAGTPYWDMNLGDVFLNQGTLAFAESLTLGNPSKGIYLSPGTTLQFFDLNVTNPMPRNIYVTNAVLTCGGAATDTNVLTGNIFLSGPNTIKPDQGAYILNGVVSGSGSLGMSANDPGRVCLNGVNSFAGDLVVTNGTVGGSGTWAGNLLMQGGTNAPGWLNPGSVLTVNGNVLLAGTTLMQLNRNLSPKNDRIAAGGTLTAGGTLVVIVAPGAPAPQGGDSYQLFNKGLAGSFASVSLPPLASGLSWNSANLMSGGIISVVGTSTPPSITSVSATGNSFVFSGTGGSQGTSYTIVAATNPAVSLSSWTPIVTNVFGTGGSFSVTNTIAPGVPTRFFRLRTP